MGEIVAVGFGILTLAGLALIGFGAVRRVRALVISGAALLLSLAGAWILGPPGVAAGVLVVPFVRRP